MIMYKYGYFTYKFMRHGESEFKDELEFSPRVKHLASLSVSFPNFIRIIFVTNTCDSAQQYIIGN